MKKYKYTLYLLATAFAMSSCGNAVVLPTDGLRENYEKRMSNSKEQEIMKTIPIYLSESEVSSDYEVISLNQYIPFRPFNSPAYFKKIYKKSYKKAATMAYKEGGNGIIITGHGQYKVIRRNIQHSSD